MHESVTWRKSSHSGASNNCVEVAYLADGRRLVRDSKDVDGPVLTFSGGEWSAFLSGVHDGEFDSGIDA